ncbi:non-ribosomal peptide synthase/polyketide synthase [Achromobacter spanius]|uniref:non-ribosomal peptide synthase/polyketide synthase n=1 Tax=Achromobacter spanius TaxID=217203 RepID=UPI003815DB9B
MNEQFALAGGFSERLGVHARLRPDDVALRFLDSDENDGREYSYAWLDRRARSVAASLLAQASPGDRVVLLFPSGPEYAYAFFACLYAGMIAVPAYPPESARPQHLQRLARVIQDAQPRCILTLAPLRDSLAPFASRLSGPDGPRIVAVDEIGDASAEVTLPAVAADAVAFLQYTSGSTSQPKGVRVTHGNLLANEQAIQRGFGIGPDDIIASWLPLYHDMGLIGGLLQPIYAGVPVVLMAPRYFLERPVRWLEAISRYRATVSGGPDFAYRLCTERVAQGALERLDLSCWRVAFCGSEPIRPQTLGDFAERFGHAGLSASALYPCYGLAEATLFVTGAQRGHGFHQLRVDAQALADNRIELSGDGPGLVDCGQAADGHALRIAREDGEPLRAGTVGEIWATGPSIADGYWRNESETERAFVQRDGLRWLRTGDLGFVREGRLYVTGRSKDMIILRGQNLYPQDIEQHVEASVELVRKGRVAAFAVAGAREEGVGIALEVGRSVQKMVDPEKLAQAIGAAVAEVCQQTPEMVLLLQPGALPKTSSGKLQRRACHAQWRAGELEVYAAFEGGRRVDDTAQAPGEAGDLPQGPVETALANVWAQVLGIGTPARDDSFFALGGNSVTAVQVAALARERHGIALLPRHFHAAASLAGLARALESEAAQAVAIPSAAHLPPVLSRAQERMWFLWQMEPQSAAYNIAGSLRLRGALAPGLVQAALDAVLARHPVLRTAFTVQQDGSVAPRTIEAGAWPLREQALDAPSPGLREALAGEIADAEARAPFDLTDGAPLRARLLTLDAQDHLLLITLHHIVADGWSMGVLIEEFARHVAALAQGGEAGLAPPSLSYHDYAHWQHDWMHGEAFQTQMDFWKTRLGDEHAPLDLPSDRPRPARRDGEGASVSFNLPEPVVRMLRTLAREEGATFFVALLAAFKAFLYRCTGQEDLRVGTVEANRGQPGTQDAVGLFVNTLVLRSALDGAMSIRQVVAALRDTVAQARAHCDLPFDALVDALQPARSASHHPLFQVLVNHQQRATGPVQILPGLSAQPDSLDGMSARFDLGLNTVEHADGAVSGRLTYATDLFDAESGRMLCARFQHWLEQAARQPDLPVARLPLMQADERERVLRWSHARRDRAPDYPPQAFVPAWISAQASRRGDAPALLDGASVVSHAEVDRRANRLAHALRRRGVGPDTVVGIGMERSADLVVAVLGVLRAGAAYLPLDPAYPPERLAYMLADSGCRLLLTTDALRDAFGDPACAIGTLRELDEPALPDMPPEVRLHADHLAYLIYTSGSTGQPKGAANTHGALRDRVDWMLSEYGIGQDDTLLLKTPFSFDVAVWEVLLPLVAGARLAIAPAEAHKDPQALARLIREHEVTTVHFVPSMLEIFADQDEFSACTSLRRIFSGGEQLPAALAARIRRAFPKVRLDNRYGPSEALINATWWPCADEGDRRVPIGRPIPPGSALVLDDEMEPAPPGVAGELYLGGSGVARGYHGRAALSGQRFVPDPHGAAPGGRLYATGDRARWRLDGVIEYLGRADQQLKVRGFRVEPGEIEAQLMASAPLRHAVIVSRPGPGGAGRLVAYVVAAREVEPDAMRAALAGRLPEYMVPAQFVLLDALPLLPSGKLDRNALPEPVWTAAGFRAPETALERAVAALWCEALEVGRVGLDDNFFELGGHSLLATQVVARVRRDFGLEFPLRALFEAASLEAFAQRVAQAQALGHTSRQPELRSVDRSQPLALSYSQERMWFLWQTEPQGTAYNVGGAILLEGVLDVDALEAGLQTLVMRHEALRTTFPSRDGVPVQRIAAYSAVAMRHQDLSGTPAHGRMALAKAIAHDEAHQPFDLEQGPLLRVSLLRLQAQSHMLLVTIHHIVSEGWAMDVFADEYIHAYEAHARGQAPQLAPLVVQYADYAAWQRRWLDSGESQRQIAWWKQALGDSHPLLLLPSDRPRPAVQSYRGDYLRFDLDGALTQAVRAFNARTGATLFMTVSAALVALLHRYSGQHDLRLGFPVANRIRPEFEGLMGAFLNTAVLRCEVQGDDTAEGLLARVRGAVLDAQANQDVPFHQVVEAVKPPRSAAHTPVFQVLCNVQRWRFQQSREAGGVKLTFMPNDTRSTKFDLMLDVSDIDGVLGCVFTYSTDLFDRATVQRMSVHWTRLLAAMVADPGQRLDALDFLDPAERRRVRDWSLGEARALDADASLDGMVSAQAARTPDAVAVCCDAQTLSYAELEHRANRLAHRLVAAGAGPDARVGICMRRSSSMVVALLASVKAGAAYVPLDPDLPRERLQYMVRDSAPALVLADRDLAPLVQGDAPVLCADDADDGDGESGGGIPAGGRHPEQLAYLIYTSGSTGEPKGAGNRHVAVCNRLAWMQRAYRLDASDTVLQKTPFGFDVSVWEFFWPLIAGARIAMAPPGAHRDPLQLAQAIDRWNVTTLHFVPSMLQAFVADASVGPCASLRRILCSGEALAAGLRDRALQRFAHASLHNLYGPTEAAIDVTHWTCSTHEGDTVPIGMPIDNVSTHVLDAQLNPVSAGVAGELYLGGVALARGYHARPGLTAERFVPDPQGEPGQRLYRSGDLVRWRPNGALEYLGRLDHQVKIHGLRIELGEIEARLGGLDDIREALVMAREEGAATRLVAYVTLRAGAQARSGAWREALAEGLPDYMVPSAWVVLDEMPLSPNGKVDRKALPAPESLGDMAAHEAAAGETEVRIAEIWSRVLGLEQPPGRHANFFALGGDSILSLRVAAELRAAGWPVTGRQLFLTQDLKSLAQALEAASGEDVHAAPIRPLSAAQRAQAPMTYAEQRLWFLRRLAPGDNGYHLRAALRIGGRFNLEAARAAWHALVTRHDALRTRYVETAQGLGRPELAAAHAMPFPAPVPAPAGQDPVAWAQAFSAQPFDLAGAPPLRVGVLQVSESEHVLVVAMHHILADDWSLKRMLEEFARDYEAADGGRYLAAARPPLQYRDYAAWQADRAASGAWRAELAYWRQALAGVDAGLDLATDGRRNPAGRYEEAKLVVPVSDAAAQALRLAARQRAATPFTALHGAFQALLFRYTGKPAVCVGVPVAGRHHAGAPDIVGLFVNTQVICSRLRDDMPLEAVWTTIQATLEAAQAHQDLPFEMLVEAISPERVLGQNPLFQVMHNHLGPSSAIALPDATTQWLALSGHQAKFELSLTTHETADGGFTLEFAYARELFDRSRIERMAGHYLAVLEALVQGQGLLGDVALTGAAERSQLNRFSLRPATYPAFEPLHALFERQAARHPHAVSVAWDGGDCSYGELDARADALADRLLRDGLAQEECVGIHAERSLDMVIALLAVLKAGGAYVPLEPAHPPARLAAMLDAANVTRILAPHALPAALAAKAGLRVVPMAGRAEGAPPRRPRVHPESLAYVIFTSGSTGTPKGVANRHGALYNRLAWMQREYALEASDVVLQKTPFGFDVSVWEFLWPLMTGARLALAAPHEHRDPELLAARMARHGVTTLHFVPSMLQAFLDHGGPAHCPAPKRVICSGEALTDALQDATLRAWPDTGLHNLYGPTEAAIDVTYWRCRAGQPVPIGAPIANVSVQVLDAALQPAPLGVAGEIYLGGAGLARGYTGRPGLTAERFVPDPAGNGRLYRTGDLGCWRADGAVTYLGRLDHQVKVRGQRIELGEVEAQLLRQPGVREAVAVAHQSAAGVSLAAYAAGPGDGAPLAPDALRAALAQILPDYMVPAVVMVLDRMPLTSNGKIDRKALPAPRGASLGGEPPQGEVEQALAQIWSELLGTSHIGRHDNFFELGGHSIAALRLRMMVQARWDVTIALALFFTARTVAQLGEAVNAALAQKGQGDEAAREIEALLDSMENPQ